MMKKGFFISRYTIGITLGTSSILSYLYYKEQEQDKWITTRVWRTTKPKSMNGHYIRNEKGEFELEITIPPVVITEGKRVRSAVNKGELTPEEGKKAEDFISIGHASIQIKHTSDGYYSFWPIHTPAHPYHKVPSTNNTPEEDLLSESRPADVSVTFYSLDKKKAAKSAEQQRADWYRLKVKGEKKFNSPDDPEFHNCTSYALRIMLDAGIDELSPVCANLKNKYLAVTPNEFADCIDSAKREESTRYPKTKNYPSPREPADESLLSQIRSKM